MTVLSDAWQFPSRVKPLFVAGTVAIAAFASCATVTDTPGGKAAVHPDFAQVHVMTQNVYDGIDYIELFGRCKQLPRAMIETLAAITASDPSARAALHASQIAQEHPDLLAIQEAVFAQLSGIT